MAKKILLINGSPRKNGLTNALLTAVKKKIDELKESTKKEIDSEILQLSDYKIDHCTGCDACLRRPNTCPLSEKDDMLKIENAMKSADAIIIGSPTYFGDMSGLVKVIIDRSRPMKMQGYQIKDKLFSGVSAAGLQNGGNNWVADSLIHFALIHGMIVVGGLGHPVLESNMANETLQMLGLKEFRKINEPGEIAIKTSANLGERIFNLLAK